MHLSHHHFQLGTEHFRYFSLDWPNSNSVQINYNSISSLVEQRNLWWVESSSTKAITELDTSKFNLLSIPVEWINIAMYRFSSSVNRINCKSHSPAAQTFSRLEIGIFSHFINWPSSFFIIPFGYVQFISIYFHLIVNTPHFHKPFNIAGHTAMSLIEPMVKWCTMQKSWLIFKCQFNWISKHDL